MRRLAVTCFAVFLLSSLGYAQPYSEIYIFGDSYTDIGNAKNLLSSYGIDFPPSPPYAEGRYCSGPVFPDVIAENLGLGPLAPSFAGGTNYAYGGARSVEERLDFGFVPIPSVRSQVETYLAAVDGQADPAALYILQAGGNDGGFAWVAYLEGGWDPAEEILEEAALGLVESVQILADAGAVNFVVKSLPVVSYAPFFCGLDVADAMGEYFNTVLKAGLGSLEGDLRILYFDLFGFIDVLADYFVSDCSFCVSVFSPTGPVCGNREQLLYWDELHYSAAVHQVIGDAITVAMLKDEVLHLTAEGVLNGGNSNALLSKLNGACRKLEDREPQTAANKMRAFANQVNALVRTGRLTVEQAELLLVGANGVMTQP